MRVLHFSDIHIGVENYSRVDPDTGFSTRLMDFLSVLDDLVDYSIGNEIDLVLFAGDAYKNRDPSQTHQRELAKRISRLTEAGIPVFLLVGNHDLPHALGRATSIEIYNTLGVPNVYVGDELKTYIVKTKAGPIQIIALPWPNRSKLLTREETKGMNIENIRDQIQTRLTKAVAILADQLDPNIPAVLTGHVTVSGATTGSEQSMMLGKDHMLLLSSIHLPQLDYVALGHIHKHQILQKDPLVVYSGSLQRVDFGEEKDTKGFCVFDLDPSLSPGGRLTDFHFEPVDARTFITIDVNISDDDHDPSDTVVRAIAGHLVKDAIVRVRVSLPNELASGLDEVLIRESLSEAHYLASVSTELRTDRRVKVPYSSVESVAPMEALRMYFEGKDISGSKLDKLMSHAKELIDEESSAPNDG